MESRSILLICDNNGLAHGISFYLKNLGYIIEHISESEAGLQRCKQTIPDLVLVHYSTLGPPPDSITLCYRLRNEVSFSHLPIFLISYSQEEALHAGATAWFDIVFDIEEIAQQIRFHLG